MKLDGTLKLIEFFSVDWGGGGECEIGVITVFTHQIKSSLYSPYYAEACDELQSPSPRLCAWVAQLRRNVATVASRWRHCVNLTGPGIETQTSRIDSVRFATELTAGLFSLMRNNILNKYSQKKSTK